MTSPVTAAEYAVLSPGGAVLSGHWSVLSAPDEATGGVDVARHLLQLLLHQRRGEHPGAVLCRRDPAAPELVEVIDPFLVRDLRARPGAATVEGRARYAASRRFTGTT